MKALRLAPAVSLAAAAVLGGAAGQANAETPVPQPESKAAVKPSSSQPPLGITLPDCPDDGHFQACVYGINNAQVFTGPGTLGPAPYYLYNSNTSWGVGKNPWPSVFQGVPSPDVTCPPKPGDQWCARFNSDWLTSGDTAQAWYAPPSPLPGWDLVSFSENNPYSGSDTATCPLLKQTNYSTCGGYTTHDDHTNDTFTVGNGPVIVEIINNMDLDDSNDLALDGAPYTTPTMILDPAGGMPTTITAGATGYFGLYQPQQSNGLPAIPPAFSASFDIGQDSFDGPGAALVVNVGADGAGNIVKAKTNCTYVPGLNSQSNPKCQGPVISGSPGGLQRVTFELIPK